MKANELVIGDYIKIEYGGKVFNVFVRKFLQDKWNGIILDTGKFSQCQIYFHSEDLDERGFEYLGHSEKRKWWIYLPSWLQIFFCKFKKRKKIKRQ